MRDGRPVVGFGFNSNGRYGQGSLMRERLIPHGGHQMSLNIAAGLGLGGDESYPDLFQPFGGFPDSVTVDEGYITMPELCGIGFEGKADLAQVCAELAC
ncbi:hypothetical protein BJF82_13255 [Kytococcus sp. CUA-901]|nr:hypothetical protein BJF82_13255 [Kytococcus sp. CUA-901]